LIHSRRLGVLGINVLAPVDVQRGAWSPSARRPGDPSDAILDAGESMSARKRAMSSPLSFAIFDLGGRQLVLLVHSLSWNGQSLPCLFAATATSAARRVRVLRQRIVLEVDLHVAVELVDDLAQHGLQALAVRAL
jgi:hypothetical protein